ncbi:unnamed protein product [Allacma fusca]|uniref:Phosphatidylinositol transfer protein N-terminal domain-containing protein n=1 Tax=Allacma fusca TaxID=39272 RepID=A0A8J2LPA5_9HEXA|nr:unnamed protein product [Allacma fusca]
MDNMLTKEYRITMPVTVEEYRIGQLYSLSEASLMETGGGEGVEVLRNESFDNYPLLGSRFCKGQYTYKKYYLASKVPAFIRFLVPNQSLIIHEESWNAYPYSRTIITNPGYMKENFVISIDTMHVAGKGDKENVHELSAEKLKQREVIFVDIANDPIVPADYKAEEDPGKFKSVKTSRGPLQGDWIENTKPLMTCYKLVSVEFKWFGLQTRVENFVQKCERRLFTNFGRQVFCWIDRWHDMSLDDVRAFEERIRDDLEQQRKSVGVRGMKAESD